MTSENDARPTYTTEQVLEEIDKVATEWTALANTHNSDYGTKQRNKDLAEMVTTYCEEVHGVKHNATEVFLFEGVPYHDSPWNIKDDIMEENYRQNAHAVRLYTGYIERGCELGPASRLEAHNEPVIDKWAPRLCKNSGVIEAIGTLFATGDEPLENFERVQRFCSTMPDASPAVLEYIIKHSNDRNTILNVATNASDAASSKRVIRALVDSNDPAVLFTVLNKIDAGVNEPEPGRCYVTDDNYIKNLKEHISTLKEIMASAPPVILTRLMEILNDRYTPPDFMFEAAMSRLREGFDNSKEDIRAEDDIGHFISKSDIKKYIEEIANSPSYYIRNSAAEKCENLSDRAVVALAMDSNDIIRRTIAKCTLGTERENMVRKILEDDPESFVRTVYDGI